MEKWDNKVLITDRPPRTIVLSYFNNTVFVISIYQEKMHIIASPDKLEAVKHRYPAWHHGHGMLVHHVPKNLTALVRELQNIN